MGDCGLMICSLPAICPLACLDSIFCQARIVVQLSGTPCTHHRQITCPFHISTFKKEGGGMKGQQQRDCRCCEGDKTHKKGLKRQKKGQLF